MGIEVIGLSHLLKGGALKPIRHYQAASAIRQNLDIIRHGIELQLGKAAGIARNLCGATGCNSRRRRRNWRQAIGIDERQGDQATGGLFAACSAAENGAKVIAVEKGAAGVGIRGTLGGIGTKWQAENGTDIKATDICHDIARYSASSVNGALTCLWATESAETVEWYGDLCVKAGREFVLCSDNDLSDEEQSGFYRHWATGHAAVVDGKTAEDDAVLTNYATEQGVDLRYSTEMIKLVKDGDRVSGAIIKDSEGACKQIDAAKGVIVCTGGYAQNPDMLSALQPDTLRIFSFNSGMPNAIGSGIKACIWAGADFDSTHTSMLFDRCPLRPDQIAGEPSDGMFWMGSQPWLKVNLEGNRFADESAPYDFILHASATQPGHTYCTIFDSNYVDYIYQFIFIIGIS